MMGMLRLGLLVVGLSLLIVNSEAKSCPTGWTRYRSKCFVVIKEKQNWPEAQKSCEVLRGNLAKISSYGENQVVGNLVYAAGVWSAWIGLNDLVKEGHFVWRKTNLAPTYTNWDKNEPNNYLSEHCVEMRKVKKWNDMPCSTQKWFVCQSTVARLSAASDSDCD